MTVEWESAALPGCHGYPCERLRLGDHIARVWQTSLITTRGEWVWSIDGGPIHGTRGNKGVAKTAALRALRKAGNVERAKLTHVAIRFRGKVWSLPAPNRHHDVIRMIVRETGADTVDSRNEDQGFLDENGTYLNRKQALVSAQLFDQIKPDATIRLEMLFSEDVW